MWRHVDLVWNDVSDESIASIFRVEKSASEEQAWAGGCSQPTSGRLNNRQDNFPFIEEATEREPRGSRIKNFKHITNN
jgi:hypothetical protein